MIQDVRTEGEESPPAETRDPRADDVSAPLEHHNHVLRVGSHTWAGKETPSPREHRSEVEPWLSALFQAEHVALLVGSGLTTSISTASGATAASMLPAPLKSKYADAVLAAARESAAHLGRGEPNLEDQVRAIRELLDGLRILARTEEGSGAEQLRASVAKLCETWEKELDDVLRSFLVEILQAERGIEDALTKSEGTDATNVRGLLGGFLLPFASRAASRERLHIFTTNYDRLIEYGCDMLGLRVVDRFIGTLAPVFHSSRLGIDLHYNPPGIRGEPRYLEGVVRLTKLHGSVDWRRAVGPSGRAEIQRRALPFGARDDHSEVPTHPGESVLIYPNPAKDTETLEYPYAELFRDFAAAACQPNAVVVTYGYGFGDSHVNRVLRDMLSLPSTHLAIISYDHADGRIASFLDWTSRPDQVSLLIGPHFGALSTLVDEYLPKPAIDLTTRRMMDLLRLRARPESEARPANGDSGDTSDGGDPA